MLERLQAECLEQLAEILEAAVRSYRAMSEETYYLDNRRMLEAAYLRADSPEGGSGFGGDAGEWRRARIGSRPGSIQMGPFSTLVAPTGCSWSQSSGGVRSAT